MFGSKNRMYKEKNKFTKKYKLKIVDQNGTRDMPCRHLDGKKILVYVP